LNALTRKQKEIEARHQLILNVARDLIIEQGYHGLTMERIAAEIEYSKGTIYQHFPNKESVLAGLTLRYLGLKNVIYSLACETPMTTEEKLIGMMEATFLLIEKLPKEFTVSQQHFNEPFRDKCKEEIHQQLDVVETSLINALSENLRYAPRKHGMEVEELSFGLWALFKGCCELYFSECVKEHLSLRGFSELMRLQVQVYMQGLGWEIPAEIFSSQAIASYLEQTNSLIESMQNKCLRHDSY
jgi:AcrR family transcriptional regulator